MGNLLLGIVTLLVLGFGGWWLLRRLRAASNQPAHPLLDREHREHRKHGDLLGPAGRSAVTGFNAGSWSPVQTLLSGPARRYWFDALGEFISRESADQWLGEASPDPARLILLGHVHIQLAREARGSGFASGVTDDGWRGWRVHMSRAEELFSQAHTLDPNDGAPFDGLLITCLGLSLPAEETFARFEMAIGLNSDRYYACAAILNYSCKKWFGSHEAMYMLLDQFAELAPHGSPIHLLAFRAHLERWLYYLLWENDEENAQSYVLRPDVNAALDAAYERFAATPTPLEGGHWVATARNLAAIWFFLSEQDERLRNELEQIGPRWTFIWGYIGDSPADGYRRACDVSGVTPRE